MTTHQRRRYRGVDAPPGYGFRVQQQQQAPARSGRCRVCDQVVDPALLEGHEESCRAVMRRRLRGGDAVGNYGGAHDAVPLTSAVDGSPASSSSASASPVATASSRMGNHGAPSQHHAGGGGGGGHDDDAEYLCVICLDSRKAVAVVPCGHLSMCRACAAQVELCPMCRGPREGLLVIDAASAKCRVCRQVIAPVYLDSHQEVCRLRTRELRETLRAEQAALDANDGSSCSAGSPPAVGDSSGDAAAPQRASPPEVEVAPPSSVEKCVGCLVAKREKALLPCGHFVMCSGCADRATQCPVCLRRIASRLTMFD